MVIKCRFGDRNRFKMFSVTPWNNSVYRTFFMHLNSKLSPFWKKHFEYSQANSGGKHYTSPFELSFSLPFVFVFFTSLNLTVSVIHS